MSLKFLIVDTYYPMFLRSFYRKQPELKSCSYQEQLQAIMAESFGTADFYSSNLKKLGYEAEDVIVNGESLQQAWARENYFPGNALEITVEQIRLAMPQVVYLQDLSVGTTEFLSAIRPHTELIVGQIASPVPPQADLGGFDIIFSSLPHFVEQFRKSGLTSYYQPLAFEPRVLEKTAMVIVSASETCNLTFPKASSFREGALLAEKTLRGPKKYLVTFIGGISPAHGKGRQILEKLAELIPVDFWGYGAESLPENSPIRKQHHGEAWGLEMFSLLCQSTITINRHIDVADSYANNMRLFEATGCGALLVTDYKDNLNELFKIGKEIVAYRSPEEAAALIKYYLRYPEEAEEIARAGQERTLREHTYLQRMKQTAEVLERHLRYRHEKNRFPPPDMSKISYGFASIQQSEISEDLTSAWQSEQIPAKQRALVQQELNGMYKGKSPVVYKVLANCLQPCVFPGCSILEIGCASGYYYEVLEYLLNKRISYTGVDYSEALISMARDYYPHPEFVVADGANLPFNDGQFFIVISSGVLLHVPDYWKHIAETARVAAQFVVAHRTPVYRQKSTRYFKKFAYGVETVELRFNEKEIISGFDSNGLKLIKAFEYYSNPEEDEFDITYLFSKHEN